MEQAGALKYGLLPVTKHTAILTEIIFFKKKSASVN